MVAGTAFGVFVVAIPAAGARGGISPAGIVTLVGLALLVAGPAVVWWRRGQQLASQRRDSITRRLLDLDEAGRKRVACAIHDALGHQLLQLKHEAELGLGHCTPEEKAHHHFAQISALAAKSLEHARGIASRLRPFELDQLSFKQAIAAMIAQVTAHSDLRLFQELEDLESVFPAEVKVQLFRITESLLENVVQHARASTLLLEFKRLDRQWVLRIEDDGVGNVSGSISGQKDASWGLRIAAERAKLLGGSLHVEAIPGHGTRVCVTLPRA